MKRYITIALLFSMLLTLSCGTEAPPVDTTSDGQTGTTAATSDPYDDALPEFDFGGAEFIMNTRPTTASSWINPTLDVESENGDSLNDAIFRRNRTLEERFNFKLVVQTEANARRDAAYNAILAGDDSFDVFLLTDRNALELAKEGMLVAYDNLEYINLDKPYWHNSINQSISISNKYYFAYGDFNLIPYDYTHMLVFNKEVQEDNKLANPFELVKSGKWTIDAYASMVKDTTRDLDGNASMDDKDMYGLQSLSKQVLPSFWIGAGVLSIHKNKDDKPEFTLASDKHFANVIDKIFDITYGNGSYYFNNAIINTDTVSRDMFVNNKGLFLDTTFKLITNLRDMDTDFGIIPYPKWDEAQKDYCSRVEGGDFPMVPVTNKKLEMTGVLLEAMCAESAKHVIPAYYDKMLKGKVARDEESAEMLDIIFRNRIYDLGDTFWNPILRDGIFLQMFNENDRALASKIAGIEESLRIQIQETIDAFEKIQ